MKNRDNDLREKTATATFVAHTCVQQLAGQVSTLQNAGSPSSFTAALLHDQPVSSSRRVPHLLHFLVLPTQSSSRSSSTAPPNPAPHCPPTPTPPVPARPLNSSYYSCHCKTELAVLPWVFFFLISLFHLCEGGRKQPTAGTLELRAALLGSTQGQETCLCSAWKTFCLSAFFFFFYPNLFLFLFIYICFPITLCLVHTQFQHWASLHLISFPI